MEFAAQNAAWRGCVGAVAVCLKLTFIIYIALFIYSTYLTWNREYKKNNYNKYKNKDPSQINKKVGVRFNYLQWNNITSLENHTQINKNV